MDSVVFCPNWTVGVGAAVMSRGRWTGERQGDATGATTEYFWKVVGFTMGTVITGREVDGVVEIVVVVVVVAVVDAW